MTRTVLVTDGNERAALAITRSLGKRDIAVIVGCDAPRSLAGSSRYCSRQIRYPSPSKDPNAFAEFLPQFLRAEEIAVVLPVTDVTTRAVATHVDRLSPCRSAVPPLQAFETVTDKRRLAELATACGVPIPYTVVVKSAQALVDVLDEVVFPVVVKACRSRVTVGARWVGTTVHYARTTSELLRLYQDVAYLRRGDSLVQERIVGTGTGLFVLYNRGRLLTAFAHRRLREKPPSGGVSVLSESIPVDPMLLEEAERLLAPLGWHGVAMLEYKQDRRRGRPVLIEVNGRFWGSLQLAVDAGVDFPFLAWQLALGQPPQVPEAYATGVRTRWFFGDVDHLLARLRGSGRDLPDAPSRRAAVTAFLAGPASRGLRNEVLRRDDLWPALHETLDYMAAGTSSLWARLRRPVQPRAGAHGSPVLQGGSDADFRE